MSQDSDSFNAHGATAVAFETIDQGPRTIGVGAIGQNCGVHGEGMLTPRGARAISVQGMGVHGRGDVYGVYGIAGSILPQDAPDLAGSSSNVFGVIGVNNETHNAPAVLGDHGLLKPILNTPPPPNRPEINPQLDIDWQNIVHRGAGVAGVSAFRGGVTAVAGLAFTTTSEALQEAVNPNKTQAAFMSAVTAIGAGPNPGVYAVSAGGRGGVFESVPTKMAGKMPGVNDAVAAQIQLVPLTTNESATSLPTTPKTGVPILPKFAQAGDLMAVEAHSAQVATIASLWFCLQGSRVLGDRVFPALWAELQFGRSVEGSF
jgi:hypothetical protein